MRPRAIFLLLTSYTHSSQISTVNKCTLVLVPSSVHDEVVVSLSYATLTSSSYGKKSTGSDTLQALQYAFRRTTTKRDD